MRMRIAAQVLALFISTGIPGAHASASDELARPREDRAATGAAVRALKVGIAQPLVVPGDVDGNIRNMEPLVAEAARRGAKLVLFSECGITGYDLKGVAVRAARPLDDPALDRVATMARTHGLVIVAGLHEKRGDKLHNTVVVFFPDGRREVQRKHNIMEPEKKIAAIAPAARGRRTFDVDGFRCAILICSDDGIPGIYDELAAARCDVVLLPTAGGRQRSHRISPTRIGGSATAAGIPRPRRVLHFARGRRALLENADRRRGLQPGRLGREHRVFPSGREFDRRSDRRSHRRDPAAVCLRASAAGSGRGVRVPAVKEKKTHQHDAMRTDLISRASSSRSTATAGDCG